MTSKKDHIAIIGAGFTGLAAAYYYSRAGHLITIYDPSPLGNNASGISAGLLHYYTGPKAKPPEDAELKLQSTLELLKAASQTLDTPVFKKTGLFRPAFTENQEHLYRERANDHNDITWLSSKEVIAKYPDLSPFPGIWISNGYQIDTKMYLKGLWLACQSMGATWQAKAIQSTEELAEDKVLITTGAAQILQTQDLPIHPIKGQILEIQWNNSLNFPISGHLYFVPSSSPNRCFVGGTFEHRFSTPAPDLEVATQLLFPKIEIIFPDMTNLQVLNIRAALRASTPNRLPILKEIDSRTSVLVGMGSKGLLNHAFYAKKLLEY